MITVVLCGSEKDNSINGVMRRALRAYDETSGEERARFLLRECTSIPSMEKANGIFVFKNSFLAKEDPKFCGDFIPVLDAQNCKAAAILNGTGKIAITCGMSAKDTLSIASLDYTAAVVSLQRNITTVTSQMIEPHDFIVTLKDSAGVYPLLAACAVLLLSGIPSGEGYCF